MPRGVTRSEYDLAQRRAKAFEWFTKGFSNAEVARRLAVHPGTVTQYRQAYEERLLAEAEANPHLLRDMINNTVRALAELEEVRRTAWEEYERASLGVTVTCPSCEEKFLEGVSSPATRNQLLQTITKTQEQRAKLLGLFGVKAEFFAHVNAVHRVQTVLLAFMRQNLCEEDKLKLERLLTTELADQIATTQAVPVIPANVLESRGAEAACR